MRVSRELVFLPSFFLFFLGGGGSQLVHRCKRVENYLITNTTANLGCIWDDKERDVVSSPISLQNDALIRAKS